MPATGKPSDEPRRLLILTGLPGSGKSSLSRELINILGPDWEILHADDFIGPTYSLYRDSNTGSIRPWPLIRSHHARFAGESVAYHMNDHRKHVLLEGHFRSSWEITSILSATADLLPQLRRDGRFMHDIFLLKRDREWILEHMVTNEHRFPDLLPATFENAERVETLRRWIFRDATIDLGNLVHLQIAPSDNEYPELAALVTSHLRPVRKKADG
jgi:hypothetical protein